MGRLRTSWSPAPGEAADSLKRRDRWGDLMSRSLVNTITQLVSEIKHLACGVRHAGRSAAYPSLARRGSKRGTSAVTTRARPFRLACSIARSAALTTSFRETNGAIPTLIVI